MLAMDEWKVDAKLYADSKEICATITEYEPMPRTGFNVLYQAFRCRLMSAAKNWLDTTQSRG
jgi:hypothetical protein